jgi:DNA-binding NarL/FixJ family response regulator
MHAAELGRSGAAGAVLQGVTHSLVVIDDHAILRDGLRALFAAEPDFQVIADTGTLAGGILLSRQLQPDVVILDISFPEGGGIEAIGTLRRHCEGTCVVVLTVHNTQECLHAAMRAGAHGFVAKDAPIAVLLAAIRSALSQSERTVRSLPFSKVRGALAVRKHASPLPKLTQRERQVLVAVAQGFTSKQIALHLGRSVKTIVKHRSNMMRKLSLHDASSVTRYAIANGLLPR